MNIMKKVFSFLLCMILTFNVTFVTTTNSYAEENIKGIVENPIYKDENIEEVYTPQVNSRASIPNFKTISEAGAYVKDEMVKRKGNIKFTIEKSYYNDMALDILNKAMEDKRGANSSEGDYLRRHWSRLEWSAQPITSQKWTLQFNLQYLSTYYQEQQVNAQVKKILDELNVYNKDNYTKTKAVHDYIVENIRYDYDLKKFSAYNAIINNNVVCNGFAAITYKMLRDLGVDTRCITGYSTGQYHAWNIVKINSYYYNLDNTWDSCDYEYGYSSDSWFLKNNSDFSDHKRDEEFTTTSFNSSYPMSKTSYKLPSNSFKLSYSDIIMKLGSNKKITAFKNGYLDNSVKWSSSNKSVASVDSKGNVKTLKPGSATITATSSNGAKASCKIRVRYNIYKSKISNISSKVYTGKSIKPSIKVYYSGRTLKEGRDYALEYGKNTSVGTGSITIVGMGDYTGSKKITFKILPGKTSSLKVVSTTKSTIKLNWKQVSSATGYRIYRSTSKDGKYTRVATITKNTTTTYTDTKLKSGKTYYYKINTYKKVGKDTYYSPFTSILQCRSKK